MDEHPYKDKVGNLLDVHQGKKGIDPQPYKANNRTSWSSTIIMKE